MDGVRALVVGVLITVAAVVQASLLSRLGLAGGSAQLLVVLAAGVGFAGGPRAGMAAGFAAGLVADAAPPAQHPLGLTALVLVVVGFLAGAARAAGIALLARLAVVAALTVVAMAVAALLGGLLGEPQRWVDLATRAPAVAGYDAVLALVVLPVVDALWRRVGPPLPRREYAR